MTDKINITAYTIIPILKREGYLFALVTKSNLKLIIVIAFIMFVYTFVIVNKSVYQKYSLDPTTETFLDFTVEVQLKQDILEAKSKFVKYTDSLNDSPNDQNSTNVENFNIMENYEQLTVPTTPNPINRKVFKELKHINKTSDNIFLLETRCSTEKGLQNYLNNTNFVLNARQCCSIESTALMNLDKPVYLFHSCPISDSFLENSPKFVKRLFTYPNVYIVRLNNSEIFNNTPIQNLYDKRLLETSLHPIEHTSDLIRLLVLWRFGGTYSDIDVVMIRSLHPLKSNWAGSQDGDVVANGLLNFKPYGVGHKLLQRVLEHISKHFDGTKWASNGPLLITPFILKQCRATTVYQATQRCEGNFTVWSPSIFYPIYYHFWHELFKEDSERKLVDQFKSSSFSVHIWNKMSHEAVARVNSTQVYVLLAREFCPEVYKNCGETL